MLKTKLKIFREHLNKTQADIADSVGVSKRGWQTYEEGKSVPGGNVFKSLARLGCNLNWLFDDNAPMLLSGQDLKDKDVQNISAIELPSDELGLGDSVELLAKIYTSKNPVLIRAVAANLHAYSEAVDNKTLAGEMKRRMEGRETELPAEK